MGLFFNNKHSQEQAFKAEHANNIANIERESLFGQVQDSLAQINHSERDSRHFKNAINAMGLLLSKGGLQDGEHTLMMYDNTIKVVFDKGVCVGIVCSDK